MFLELRALRGPPGSTPVATSINCLSAPPSESVIRQGGVVQSISADRQSLTVKFDGQTNPTALVLFAGSMLPPAPNDIDYLIQSQLHVDVEYQVVGGRNQLRSITPPPRLPAPQ